MHAGPRCSLAFPGRNRIGFHLASVIAEIAPNQLVAVDLEMHGDVPENRSERPHAELGVIGNGDVALAPRLRVTRPTWLSVWRVGVGPRRGLALHAPAR